MELPNETATQSLASQQYWDKGWEKLEFFVAPPKERVRVWLEKYVQPGSGSALELGCFPGRYLAVFGDLGYELHGIDLTPRIEIDMPQWLKKTGYRTGEFVRADIWKHDFKRQFDIVTSCGLIEHFENWPALLRRHMELIKPGGWLVVSVPNFRGCVQKFLHQWLDRDNLAIHNLDAMDPYAWKEIVSSSNFKTVFCGSFGHFDFWEGGQKGLSWTQRTTLRVLAKAKPVLSLLPDAYAYSPYCGLVAQKIA